jgi:hypothetical protein
MRGEGLPLMDENEIEFEGPEAPPEILLVQVEMNIFLKGLEQPLRPPMGVQIVVDPEQEESFDAYAIQNIANDIFEGEINSHYKILEDGSLAQGDMFGNPIKSAFVNVTDIDGVSRRVKKSEILAFWAVYDEKDMKKAEEDGS